MFLVLVTLLIVSGTLSGFVLGQVLSVPQTTRTIANVGAVNSIGVGVYWDINLINKVSSINWGTLQPGAQKSFVLYIRNEGNSAVTLSQYTSNWNPSTASSYMTLSWNYGGQKLNAGSIAQVTVTLSVSSSITGITSFSFDITIIGTATG